MRMDSGSCLDHNNLDLQNLLEVQAPHPAPADCPQPRTWDLAAPNRLVLVQDGVFPPLQPTSPSERHPQPHWDKLWGGCSGR